MLTPRAKRIVVVASVCGIISVASFAAAFVYVAKQGATLRERAQAVANHAVQQQTYQALAALVTSTKDDREELYRYLVTEAETIDFLAEIEGLAATKGVTITTDTLTVEEGKDFNTLKINLTLAGEERPIHDVIQILETLPYMSYINRLKLSTDPAGVVTGTVELRVMLAKS